MKVKLTKASDWKYEEEIEIHTLQDLIDLENTTGSGLVTYLSGTMKDGTEPQIVIYDYYME